MKRIYRLALAAATIIPLAALVMIAGCESADKTTIDVTPPHADLTKGNPRVTLSAKGWSDYTWKLEKDEIGFLSSTHGESVIYSARQFPENTAAPSLEQIINVSARNVITSSNDTYTTEVIIRHLP